jgi:hypothetical protein
MTDLKHVMEVAGIHLDNFAKFMQAINDCPDCDMEQVDRVISSTVQLLTRSGDAILHTLQSDFSDLNPSEALDLYTFNLDRLDDAFEQSDIDEDDLDEEV